MARVKAEPKKHVEGETKSEPPATGGVKKSRRWRSGTVAKREIRMYQSGKKSTRLLIPKAPMMRLIKSTSRDTAMEPVKWAQAAVEAVHTAAEDELTRIFKNTYRLTMLRKASTISKQDLQAAKAVGLY